MCLGRGQQLDREVCSTPLRLAILMFSLPPTIHQFHASIDRTYSRSSPSSAARARHVKRGVKEVVKSLRKGEKG